MPSWTFYPAFVGTFISVVAWTYLVRKEHLTHMPRTLSELAAEKPEALKYYRTVLWICGPLFAITMFAFVLPRISHPFIIGVACALTVISEMLIGFFPAQRGKITTHDVIAGLMGISMIATAYLFAWSLTGAYANIEFTFALCMSVLGLLCLLDRKRYLFYELPLIFIAHFSILIAALALL
jgi:hypothetical protein